MADALYIPIGALYDFAGTPSFTTFALNGTTDQWEVVFAAENDGSGNLTITKVGFRYGVRTGTPPTYIISLQGVDTSGNPDGTIKGGGTPASATFTPPASTAWDGTWQWVTLTNSYAAAPGEMLALVIAYSSGTCDVSNNSTFTTVISGANNLFPYSIQNDATVRTRMGSTSMAIYGYSTASKAYGRPLETITTHTFQSGTNPNEHAVKFSLPDGWSNTYKLAKVRWTSGLSAANTVTQRLYNGGGAADTTVLQDVAFDTDFVVSATARPVNLSFDETSLTALNFSSEYRVSWNPSAAVNMTLISFNVAAATDWDAWPGGENFQASTRNAGNWTDTATRRYLCELILVDITEAAVAAAQSMLIGGIDYAIQRRTVVVGY